MCKNKFMNRFYSLFMHLCSLTLQQQVHCVFHCTTWFIVFLYCITTSLVINSTFILTAEQYFTQLIQPWNIKRLKKKKIICLTSGWILLLSFSTTHLCWRQKMICNVSFSFIYSCIDIYVHGYQTCQNTRPLTAQPRSFYVLNVVRFSKGSTCAQ